MLGNSGVIWRNGTRMKLPAKFYSINKPHFGFHPKYQLENFITKAAKAHMYYSRMRNQIQHIDVFLMRLRDIYITER